MFVFERAFFPILMEQLGVVADGPSNCFWELMSTSFGTACRLLILLWPCITVLVANRVRVRRRQQVIQRMVDNTHDGQQEEFRSFIGNACRQDDNKKCIKWSLIIVNDLLSLFCYFKVPVRFTVEIQCLITTIKEIINQQKNDIPLTLPRQIHTHGRGVNSQMRYL